MGEILVLEGQIVKNQVIVKEKAPNLVEQWKQDLDKILKEQGQQDLDQILEEQGEQDLDQILGSRIWIRLLKWKWLYSHTLCPNMQYDDVMCMMML